jgi:hypothetical protein
MRYSNFIEFIDAAHDELLTYGQVVDAGTYQGVPTKGKPDLQTMEVLNFAGQVHLPTAKRAVDTLRMEINPDLPWADDHFEERVSRVPSNPGEQYKNWRWWDPNLDEWTAFSHWDKRTETFRFDHTYQERIWPKHAATRPLAQPYPGRTERAKRHDEDPLHGIRYEYGDLDDVVALLRREPFTRQAYLPIWFPEDTGVVFGGRAPCTLGYHFMRRENRLHMWYDIRSCDFVRHFRNDLYLASRLLLWVLEELNASEAGTAEMEGPEACQWVNVMPGYLYFCAHSLHYFKGDQHRVTRA